MSYDCQTIKVYQLFCIIVILFAGLNDVRTRLYTQADLHELFRCWIPLYGQFGQSVFPRNKKIENNAFYLFINFKF